MTKQNAVENHRKMWRWIAEQNRLIAENKTNREPVTKEHYFKAHRISPKEIPVHYCYACKYAITKSYEHADSNHCNYCPIDWTNKGNIESEICVPQGGTSLYNLFAKARRMHDASACAKIAKQIADLPERNV